MSTTNQTTKFTFIESLRPEGKKTELAKEVAIIAKSELQGEIAVIDSQINKEKLYGNIQAARQEREASKAFSKTLGNISNFNLGATIDAYKQFKNASAALNTSKIESLVAEKVLLQEILDMYPTDVEQISVDETQA